MKDIRTLGAKILCVLLMLLSIVSLFLPWYNITINEHIGSYFWLVVFGPALLGVFQSILLGVLALALLVSGVYAISAVLQGNFKPVRLFRNIALALLVVFLLVVMTSGTLSWPLRFLFRDFLIIGFWLCLCSALAVWLCAWLLPRRKEEEK